MSYFGEALLKQLRGSVMTRSLRIGVCVAAFAAMGSVASLAHAQTNSPAYGWCIGVQHSLPHVKQTLNKLAQENSHKTGTPARFLIGVAMTETHGNPKSGNLMQVTVGAQRATGLKCNIRRSECSMAVAARYIQYLRDENHLSLPRAIVAYNRGLGGAVRVSDPLHDPYYLKVAYVANKLDNNY